MSIINSQPLIGASGQGGYFLSKSLRFRSSASAYLNRTPASAGNQKTWTWSGWVKRGILANQMIFNAGVSLTTFSGIQFTSSNQIEIFEFSSSGYLFQLTSTQVFRDPSAWYHIVVAFDTTQATASNRLKLYINGSQVTSFATANYPVQNTNYSINNNVNHEFCRSAYNGSELADCYLAEVNFVNASALTPSSFGQTNPATGVWQPIKYSGTYGTNGFYLNFSDNSSNTATTIGKDYSGNGNNWTPNNISVTSGATYDSMTDVPTLTSESAANYCTLNPLSAGRTISQANMYYAGSATGIVKGTIGVTTGKWYWEFTGTDTGSSAGVADITLSPTRTYLGDTINGWMYISGTTYNNNTGTGGRPTFTTGDVIGVAVDVDSGKLWFSKNGVWIASGDPATGANAVYSNLSGYTLTPASGSNTILDAGYLNCGQRPFAYTPPTGFKALNTFNLPTPTIGATASSQANKYMDVSLYTGNGSTQLVTNSGSFQPDFIWMKKRDTSGQDHVLQDAVRGFGSATKLASSSTAAENNTGGGVTDPQWGYVTSAASNGFNITVGSGSGDQVNKTSGTYVGWQWRASNATGVTNTSGSITSTVSANTSAGFSIVTYTGTGANATVGHGLGVAPRMVIVKRRNAATFWPVYHIGVNGGSSPQNYYMQLQGTAAQTADSSYWNNTAPTSSVFSVGTSGDTNANTGTYVAYCFSEVAGYSKFGSYTGNGSTDGAFVYLGFRPKFVMIKRTDAAGQQWSICDTARNTYNASNSVLFADASDAEVTSTSADIDYLSNGFKLRNTSGGRNANGGTYIYMALAENPFKYAVAC